MNAKGVVVAIAAIAAACGPSEKDENNGIVIINNGETNNGVVVINNGATDNNAATNNTPDPGTSAANVKLGLIAPEAAHTLSETTLAVGAAAVFEASIQGAAGEQLVTTGTLTQQGQQFVYSPTPNDKLRIVWSEGPPTDFFVTAFDGDFSGDSAHFVRRDHIVNLRGVREGAADLTISSQRQSGSTSATLSGSFTYDGAEYTVDASESGTYSASADFGSPEYESETTFTGSIQGSNGFSQTVNEYFRFKLVNEVTNDDRQANSTWTLNGKEYTLENLRIRWEEIRGYPNPSDYWIIQGEVYEDGQLIGQVGYETNTLWISIFVQIGAEKIELYRFQLAQE